jgi:multiple sugar transport system permease protein
MRLLQRVLIYALLLLGSVIFLIPLLWMISTGLKPIEQTMSLPPTWIPYRLYVEKDGTLVEIKQSDVEKYPAAKIIRKTAPRWENFAKAIRAMKFFPLYLKNTLLLCLLTVTGTVLSSALAAYGFSRIDWCGRNKVFLLALATMMVPFPVVMVPLYCMFRALGWIGTLKPLWVGSFFAGAFNVFLLRQFFMTIPKDLSEAARIDGCSELRIFWQIILPLCRPALMVVALFQFMATWNDFLGPLIFLTDQKDFTLALGLQFFQSQHGGTEWHYLMAASTLVALPIIVLFFFTQKTFIEGISMTGIKG